MAMELPPELTQSNAMACLCMLQQSLHQQTAAQVVIDASGLSRFDSSALAVLLEVRRTCEALGKHFFVNGLPASLGDLAALYGITELLPALVG